MKTKLTTSLMLIVVLMVSISCNEELPFDEQLAIDVALIDEYLTENNITAETDISGLRYVIEEPGNEKSPSLYSAVTVRYKGNLMKNGKSFDENVDGTTFYLSRLIPAWQYGLPKIGEGGKMMMYVPSGLGYGPAGSGDDIPSNANLIFEIELVTVK